MNVIFDNTELEKILYFDGEYEFDYRYIESLASFFFNTVRSESDIKNQKSVCILLDRGALFIASILAAWRAGFYVIPLNTQWPDNKNRGIIERTRPDIILVEEGLLDGFSAVVLERSRLLNLPDKSFPVQPLRQDDLAYIIFTSGSTGEPKGVMISARSFRAYIDWTKRYFSNYSKSKRLLLTSELTFDITMGDIAFALSFGTDIGVARQHKNIPSILAMIMKYQIDVLYSVPTTHLSLLNFSNKKRGASLSSLRLIISGGDRFPWSMVEQYHKLASQAHFYNVYGPTEVTINCFAIRLDDKYTEMQEKNKPVPIGQCFDSLEFFLDGDEGSDSGELCIQGEQIMLGYHADLEKTNQVVKEKDGKKTYLTGDLAYLENQMVFLKGRIDGLVKIKGYRIHPDEVAKALDTLENVDSSAVIAYGDEEYKTLVAFVKMSKNIMNAEAILKEELIKLIPDYMIPSQFYFENEFPLNQSGKIDKRQLKERLDELRK